MNRIRSRSYVNLPQATAAAVIILLLLCNVAAAAERSSGKLAEGTPYATPFYIQDTGQPGPTVMIVGGMHGNEPAGAYAAEQIRHWSLVRGKLIIVPRANVKALDANKRLTPDIDESLSNLNRNFAAADKPGPPRGELAAALWQLVEQHKPLWLLDLHEGYDFNQLNSKSVGSTLIVQPSPDADEVAELMLAAVNATIDDDAKKFRKRGPPIDTSLARAAGEHLNIRSMILETTSKDQPLSQRARQHRTLVHRFFSHLNMLEPAVTADWLLDRDRAAATTRVAVYDAGGTGGVGVAKVIEQLGKLPSHEVVRVGPADIRGGSLKQFGVVMFTGGSGSKQAAALGEAGRQQVQQFVEGGGGYIGICAGSYLACDSFSWGLKVLDAKTVSPKWQRGRGTVAMQLTDRGRQIFGTQLDELQVLYHNGPILAPNASPELPDYEPLAIFRTEVANNGTPVGIMTGSPAIVAGQCGRGRVLCISPHPEQTTGLEQFVPRAVHWVSATDKPDVEM